MKNLVCTLLGICILFSAAFAQPVAGKDIPFELLPSGHILVKASVSGIEGNFIFDTGAGMTVFTKTFFGKLPRTIPEDGGYTAFRATGERLDVDLFYVEAIELGSLKKTHEEVSYIDADLGGIDGILSLKLVEGQPFTIDFTRKRIRLETPQSLSPLRKTARRLPVQMEQSRNKSLTLFAYFRINDTLNLQLALDSGAGKDVFRLNAKYIKRLGVDTEDTARVKKIEKRSEFNDAFISTIYTTRLRKLSAADAPSVATSGFPVQFVDGLIYDGIIWINWLGSKITFDLAENQLLVQ